MLHENVETLRRYHELLNETGEPPLDLFHRDLEIHMFEGSPIRGGLISRFDGYRRRTEALEAAAMRE